MADLKRLGMGALLGDALGGVVITAQTLDSSGGTVDRVGWTFSLPEDATIIGTGFRYGTRTGTPPTFITGIQGVDASGLPDGTYLGGGSPASQTFTPPADATWNSTWRDITLANSIALSKAPTVYAMVIEYSSGTIDASNNSSFGYGWSAHGANRGFPCALTQTNGAAWSKSSNRLPIFTVSSATKTYGCPFLNVYQTAIGTNGHRQALKFTLPAGSGDTFKIVGLRVSLGVTAGETLRIGLWDSAGTAIQSTDYDADIMADLVDGFAELYFDDTPTALNFGTAYYLGIERVAGASFYTTGVTINAAGELSAMPGGSEWHLATWNGSAWSDVTTTRPLISPIFSDMTEPSGGGGGFVIGG